MDPAPGSASKLRVALAVLNYSFCSGGMILFNKLVMHHLRFPCFVSIVQFGFCSAALAGMRTLRVVEVDPLVYDKVVIFMYYNGAFVLSIYCNMRALQGSNVDTVIVFRSCLPLLVCVLEWMFLGRQLPSLGSFGALLLIILGAAGYVYNDSAFRLLGWSTYTWCLLWLGLLCFLMTFGKSIVENAPMASLFGHVYYTNVLSIPPMMALGVVNGELLAWSTIQWTWAAVAFLFLSSVVGVGLSYTGWECRSLLSATSYTLVGVMCKVIPVAINAMIWDKHASPKGIACLLLCIAGGCVYTQPPMRPERPRGHDSDGGVGPGMSTSSPVHRGGKDDDGKAAALLRHSGVEPPQSPGIGKGTTRTV